MDDDFEFQNVVIEPSTGEGDLESTREYRGIGGEWVDENSVEVDFDRVVSRRDILECEDSFARPLLGNKLDIEQLVRQMDIDLRENRVGRQGLREVDFNLAMVNARYVAHAATYGRWRIDQGELLIRLATNKPKFQFLHARCKWDAGHYDRRCPYGVVDSSL